jgi:CubicO group peptidase (beta-lactamase class C family)
MVSGNVAYDAIDTYIERQMRRLNMPGVSLAIVAGDQIVHMRGFGRARRDGGPPLPTTAFPIASVTKSFTAVAVMQLVEAGKIDLDDPVQCYLPWFRVADAQASAQVTVRHLLNQTSGLPTWAGELFAADFDDSPGAAERQLRALSTLRLTRPPGSAYEYCNSNYLLLGLIVEAASGESYAGYVRNQILLPLGMSHTYTSPAEAKQNGLAVGHQYWFMVPFASSIKPVPSSSLAGGGLISSAEDMARYLIALLNGGRCGSGRILSPDGIAELQRGVGDIRFMGRTFGQYAMGWMVDKIGGTRLVWHGGTLPDFSAYVALVPEQKKGVVLFFNACHHWMTPVLAEVGLGMTAVLAGGRFAGFPLFRVVPWALRALLLMPALQAVGVAADLRRLRRLRIDAECRPSGGGEWGRHVLLPLIPNLLAALTLLPMLGKRRGYRMLYKPDSSWTYLVCGSLALIWSLLRTGWVLRILGQTRRAAENK